MDKEIIDNVLFEPKVSDGRPPLKSYSSLAILWIGIFISIANGIVYDWHVILGILLVILSTGITYFNHSLGVKVTFGIIILGVISVAHYFPSKLLVGITLGRSALAIEVITLTICILHCVTNRKILLTWLERIYANQQAKNSEKAPDEAKIQGFKQRFSRKNIVQLQAIVENPDLLPEARRAAMQLIDERNAS